jgi:hypothetical protein
MNPNACGGDVQEVEAALGQAAMFHAQAVVFFQTRRTMKASALVDAASANQLRWGVQALEKFDAQKKESEMLRFY